MSGRVSEAWSDDMPSEERILSQSACEAMYQRLQTFARGGGKTLPTIISWWNGELRWGRNRVTLTSDRREVRLSILRQVQGLPGTVLPGTVTTNQFDDESLEAAVHAAEFAALREGSAKAPPPFDPPMPQLAMPKMVIWSDKTFNTTPQDLTRVAHDLVAAAEPQQLWSAGYLEVRAGSLFRVVGGTPQYQRFTQAQCSLTVRDSAGTGSGWAGGSSYDWAALNPAALGKRALEKCIASRNPVALEPGRYTVILEPQAVADLMESLVGLFARPAYTDGGPPLVAGEPPLGWAAESRGGPFRNGVHPDLGIGLSKLGLKVVDERLTLEHDLADPLLGILPRAGMVPVKWIDKGVLTALDYGRDYAINSLGENTFVHRPALGYRLTGSETTSVEQMIATTKRGLLVTRLWGVRRIDEQSALSTGLTRDGLWLIENGKITAPVKNFRFVESPLFVLNRLDQVGESVPVFRPVRDPYAIAVDNYPLGGDIGGSPITPAIVPAIKTRDFAFTAMVDAF